VLTVRWAATALFVLAVPVFLVLTNVRVAATELRTYDYAFSRHGAPVTTGLERAELDRAALIIVRYFQSSAPGELLDIRVQDGPDQVPLFTQREVIHMRDVRDLIQGVFRVHELAFVYIAAYIAAVFLWSREGSMRRLAQQAVWAGVLTMGVLGAAAVGVLVGFDDIWTQFHLISFSNEFWLLDPSIHRLIQMFPHGFWYEVTLALGLVTFAQGALLALMGWGYMSWVEHRRRRAWRAERRVRAERPAAAE
jgi:integral membrane protein (TIGR01906 family)